MATLEEQIAQAQDAASNVIDAEVIQDNLPTFTGAAAAPVSYQKPSMETLGTTNGISKMVDTWLKVNKYGLFIGDAKKALDTVNVKIKLVDEEGFFVKHSIKWGNPVKYASSYDGVTSDKGGLWADVVARAQMEDPAKAKVFSTADILMELREDVKTADGKEFKAGTKIGHTLSMSNWQNWVEFYREAGKAGLVGTDAMMTVGYEEVSGKNGYEWGVATFRPTAN